MFYCTLLNSILFWCFLETKYYWTGHRWIQKMIFFKCQYWTHLQLLMVLLNNNHNWQKVKHRHNSSANQMISVGKCTLMSSIDGLSKINTEQQCNRSSRVARENNNILNEVNQKHEEKDPQRTLGLIVGDEKENEANELDWIKYSKRTNELKNKTSRIISEGFIRLVHNKRKTTIKQKDTGETSIFYLWENVFGNKIDA